MKHMKLTQHKGSKPVFVIVSQVTAVRSTSNKSNEGRSVICLTGGNEVEVMENADEVMKRMKANR